MFSTKTALFSIIIAALCSSCASSYKAINPSQLNYPESSPDANFSYKYNVLKQANNKKLAKKEDKTDIKIVAVKIVNNTGYTLKYGLNYKIYSGNQVVDILPTSEVAPFIKETVPAYLLYLLLTPARLNVSSESGKSSSTPIGYVLGPGLAAINMGIAAGANKKFKNEMDTYSPIDREINNGETFYGLIGIKIADYAPLSLKIQDK